MIDTPEPSTVDSSLALCCAREEEVEHHLERCIDGSCHHPVAHWILGQPFLVSCAGCR